MATLHPPLFISSRLMAAVKVPRNDHRPSCAVYLPLDAGFGACDCGQVAGTIHVGMEGLDPRDGVGSPRRSWTYLIEDADDTVLAEGDDLIGPTTHAAAMESLLSFLGAAAEARDYANRTGRPGENEDLFPEACVTWAQRFSDELAVLQFELTEEESP